MGFGPFLDVRDNPARRLALALEGRRLGAWSISGAEMPVGYLECMAETEAQVQALQPELLLGVGVARRRERPMLERWACNEARPDLPDAMERCWSEVEAGGPARLSSSWPDLALPFEVSDDAGRYVCNAWLYQALRRWPQSPRVGFLHVPPQGMAPALLLSALSVLPGAQV
jgi:pyroglutamyl-peptidase